jgi:hypothetical protein
MADIDASVRQELPKVDPTPFFQKDGENAWAAVKGYLDACTDAAAAPVIEKYRGAGGSGRLHSEHHVLGHGVDPPGSGLCLERPPIEERKPMATAAVRDQFGGSRRAGEGARCCL